ncbi:MAG TPA: outer membrane beta-barrel protein [Bryobacteraceae bacterium]|jgi:opacity protein-like surface antigen|nr:outer membrane beta-barrel protein [Bryobacteraceae bacterium]
MRRYLPILMVVFSGALWAQSADLYFVAGESILSNNGLGALTATGNQKDVHLDNGFRFGFRFGWNSAGHMGHEIQYAYSRTHLIISGTDIGGMAIHEGGYNFLLYATPEEARFRPFGTVGVHFANFVPPGSSATSGGGSNKFGFNYGAGVKVKVTSLFGLRFDVRQYQMGKPDFFGGTLFSRSGLLRQTEVSAGVGIHF